MKRGDYIETRAGQVSLLNTRKLHRRHLFLQQPLRGKGSMKAAEQIAFQSHLIDSMEQMRQRPLSGRVVLELDFSTSQPNPPEPQSLAKNYIDLLYRPIPALKTKRRALWFVDDRQIDILAVSYGTTTNEPTIMATASPLRDVEADLGLLDRIRQCDFKDAERPYWQSDEDRESHEDETALTELRELRRDRESWLGAVPAETYDIMLDFHLTKAQQGFLARNDRLLESALVSLLSQREGKASRFPFLDVLQQTEGGILMTDSISLALGTTPQEEGESALFKQRVEAALKAFREQWQSVLFPLRTLLAASILFVPPDEGQGQGIDLDNLARKIIPVVHSILLPPSTYARARDLPGGTNNQFTEFWQKLYEAERRFPKYSVTRYTVIKLPRTLDDPSDGFVRLMFGDGLPGTGLLSRIRDKLRKWEESTRRR